MGFFHWLGDNWFEAAQTAGIIGGLVFGALSLRADERARRVGNLITVTHEHRDIWKELYRRPGLSRVLLEDLDATAFPITREEELFVKLLILHLASSYHALRAGLIQNPAGLREDIRRFFALPIPHAVWEKLKQFQDEEFVRFVEGCRAAD